MKKPSSAIALLICIFCCAAVTHAQKPEYGEASYYDDSFHGGETAYGVKYDKNKMTCAHKIHPFGSRLRVTRLDNKRSVDVTVIDKGPYLKGRVVDLSRRAAQRLGMIDERVVDVKVELLETPGTSVALRNETPDEPVSREDRPSSYDDPLRTQRTPTTNENRTEERPESTTTTASNTREEETAKGAAKPAAKKQSTAKARLVGKDYAAYDLYQIQLMRPAKKGFGVQVASLVTYEYVLRQVADLQARGFDDILISVEKGSGDKDPVYKVIIGNFDSKASAENYKRDLKRRYRLDGFVVDLGAVQY